MKPSFERPPSTILRMRSRSSSSRGPGVVPKTARRITLSVTSAMWGCSEKGSCSGQVSMSRRAMSTISEP